jgi:hypothetical protein
MGRLIAVLLAASSLPSAAQTVEAWTCKFGPDGETARPFEMRYEVKGRNVLGYEDDLTGKPNIYDIVEDTGVGLIAIRHQPDSLTFVMIDRRSGKFTLRYVHISGGYEERDTGACTKS